MPATSSVLTGLTGPRKAETIRRLTALGEVVGVETPIGWVVAAIEADHAGNPASWRAEVLDVVRIVLGEVGGSAPGDTHPLMPMG